MPAELVQEKKTNLTLPKPPASPAKDRNEIDKTLIKELKSLSKEVSRLKNLEFVKILKHPWKFMWLSFLKGLMVGFGSVLGASVLVAIFIYIMAQISFVPIVGDFMNDLFQELNIQESLTEQAINNEEIINQLVETQEQLNR